MVAVVRVVDPRLRPPTSTPISHALHTHLCYWFASNHSLVVSFKTGFITDPSKVVLLPSKELWVTDKEEAQNTYSRANDGLRRSVAGKSLG